MGGGDHHFFAGHGFTDDFFLQPGQFGIANLHAQIATRHHHHVAGIHDFGQVFNCFGTFDLGHQRGVAAMCTCHPARFVHVFGIAAERHRDEVHLHARGNHDQLAVFLGDRAQ